MRLGLAPKEAMTIEQRLRHAGRDWFQLREEGDAWLLNPVQQDRYNHGWFTLADLEEWVHDRGPIVKGDAKVGGGE